jgi:hypothetical protein
MKTITLCAMCICLLVSCAGGESDRERKVRESKEQLQHTLDSIDTHFKEETRKRNDTINSLNSGATIKELRKK